MKISGKKIIMKEYLRKNYTRINVGYKLYVSNDLCDDSLADMCRGLDERSFGWQQNSKCAKFARFEFEGNGYYIKKFEDRDLLEKLKSVFKGSRAFREFRGNVLLLENGALAPIAVAIIENKNGNYIITKEIKAKSTLYLYLKDRLGTAANRKRAIALMAEELASLHNKRIIPGDLNLNNVLVQDSGDDVCIYILDNERTFRRLCPAKGIVKNLVQLNKCGPNCVTMTERLRFFKLYAKIRGIDCRDWSFLAMLIDRTVKRRAKSSCKNLRKRVRPRHIRDER